MKQIKEIGYPESFIAVAITKKKELVMMLGLLGSNKDERSRIILPGEDDWSDISYNVHSLKKSKFYQTLMYVNHNYPEAFCRNSNYSNIGSYGNRPRPIELIENEIEIIPDKEYSHNMILFNKRKITIACQKLTVDKNNKLSNTRIIYPFNYKLGVGKFLPTTTGSPRSKKMYKDEPISFNYNYKSIEEAVLDFFELYKPKKGQPDNRISFAGFLLSPDKKPNSYVINKYD